jgi:antitoxin component of RelBE/YafQ-DinJ toxin-antitoxin module
MPLKRVAQMHVIPFELVMGNDLTKLQHGRL